MIRLALEKLLSKRQRMIEDFRMGSEFPALMARVTDRMLDFDPRVAGALDAVTVRTRSGSIVPLTGQWGVRSGRLVRLP